MCVTLSPIAGLPQTANKTPSAPSLTAPCGVFAFKDIPKMLKTLAFPKVAPAAALPAQSTLRASGTQIIKSTTANVILDTKAVD